MGHARGRTLSLCDDVRAAVSDQRLPSLHVRQAQRQRARIDLHAVHGAITAEIFTATGARLSAIHVAQRLNQSLAGRDLYSDSPFDQKWMAQLFDAAGLEPAFEMKAELAPALIDNLRVELGFTEDDVAVLFRRADHEAPHIDRAEPDARHLAAMGRAADIPVGAISTAA